MINKFIYMQVVTQKTHYVGRYRGIVSILITRVCLHACVFYCSNRFEQKRDDFYLYQFDHDFF